MKRFVRLGYLSYFLIGTAHVVMGAVLQELLVHYGKDYRSGGLIAALQFTGFLIGVLSGPWWMRRLGGRGTLLLCLTLLAVAEAVYMLLPPWGLLLTTAVPAGFGFGMVEAVIGAVTIKRLGADVTRVMSRLEFFFGVGALAMPFVAGLLIGVGGWRYAYAVVGLLAVVAAFGWYQIDPGFAQVDRAESASASRNKSEAATRARPYAIPLFVMFILLFIAYVGTEMSLVNFLPAVISERMGISAWAASFSVTVFWATMSVGRLFVAHWADRYGHLRILAVAFAGSAVLFALYALPGFASIGFVLFAAVGLLLSGVFAVGLIVANRFFPGQEERTTSLLIASGGLGGMCLPPFTGWLMDTGGAVTALWAFAGFTGFMLILTGGVSLFRAGLRSVQATAGGQLQSNENRQEDFG